MKFLLVLLAVFKYILLFLLILLLLIIILTFVFSMSPIRYSVTVNYKETDLYLNINATYLGKIVGFNFKKKNKQSQMVARVFNKKIKITPDNPEVPPKTNSEQKNKNLSTKVAQKVTPTDTLKENTNLNSTTNDSNLENNPSNINSYNIEVTENISEQNINDVQDITKEATVEKATVDIEKETVDAKVEVQVETESEAKKESENKAKIEVEEEPSSNTSSESTKKTKKRTSLGEKIYSVFENFNSGLDKIYSYIYTYQTYPYRDKLFKKFKKIINNFFDALKPKTIDISGKFYIKDPALTGKTLGYVYALYGLSTRFNISLDADFETEKTDVTALVSGKIIIFKLVLPVVSFIWLGLKAEAKRRGITRFKLIKILIQHE